MIAMTYGYRKLTPETWARAQQDFLAGASAAEVCDRYGMGLRTLRRHAADEAWRRTDTDDPVPADWHSDSHDALAPHYWDYDADDALDEAHGRLMVATLRGQSAEALRWFRLKTLWEKEALELAQMRSDDEIRCAAIRQDRLARGLPLVDLDLDPAEDPDGPYDEAHPNGRARRASQRPPLAPPPAVDLATIGTIGTIGTANFSSAISAPCALEDGDRPDITPSTDAPGCGSLLSSANLGPTTETILDPASPADHSRFIIAPPTGRGSDLDLDPL